MERGDRFARRAKALRLAMAALLGAALAVTALPARYAGGAGLAITLSLRLPASGRTVVELPPLGEVDARTHTLPVELRLRLDRVEPVAVRVLAESPSKDQYRRLQGETAGFIRDSALRFGVRQAVLAGLGAAVALYLAGVRRVRRLALGGLAATGAMLLLAFGTLRQFDAQAFSSPRYRGVLEAAPQVIETARMGVEALGDVGRRLQKTVSQLASLYQWMETAPQGLPPDAELVVAHVSDLHNNPAGFDLVEAVVQRFGVSLVIDTGDMLDLGSSLEPLMLDRIRNLGVPYLFAAGNHDTPRLLQSLEKLPNVRVLRGEPVEVAGLWILGVADPAAFGEDPEPPGPEALREAGDRLRKAAEALERRTGGRRADIIAVHNGIVARDLPPGIASAVIFGHDHKLSLDVQDGTAYVDAGSTGAEGLRGLGGSRRAGMSPFSLALLRFDTTSDRPRLWAVDRLSLDGVTGELSVERRLVGLASTFPARDGSEQGEGASRVEPLGAGAEPAR